MPLMQKQPLPEETRLAVEARLAEGWPVKECIKTGLISKNMAARHFKGRGWTNSQAGSHSQMVQRMKVRL